MVKNERFIYIYYFLVDMIIQHQIDLCSRQYRKWKEIALKANSITSIKKSMERALFWLELQSAFLALWYIEQNAKDAEIKKKILFAKVNLAKKLTEYAAGILKELRLY
jgi:hypothetical protein